MKFTKKKKKCIGTHEIDNNLNIPKFTFYEKHKSTSNTLIHRFCTDENHMKVSFRGVI